MNLNRIIKGTGAVIAAACVVAVFRLVGCAAITRGWNDWQLHRAHESATLEANRSRQIEALAEAEPGLRPLLPNARAAAESRRHQFVLEASERAFDLAGERFAESRRLADEGHAIVTSATALGSGRE